MEQEMEQEKNTVIEIKWCGLCKAYYVTCPKCGNNSCNGGYGILPNGEKCDCSKSYDLMYAMQKNEEIDKLIYEMLGEERI